MPPSPSKRVPKNPFLNKIHDQKQQFRTKAIASFGDKTTPDPFAPDLNNDQQQNNLGDKQANIQDKNLSNQEMMLITFPEELISFSTLSDDDIPITSFQDGKMLLTTVPEDEISLITFSEESDYNDFSPKNQPFEVQRPFPWRQVDYVRGSGIRGHVGAYLHAAAESKAVHEIDKKYKQNIFQHIKEKAHSVDKKTLVTSFIPFAGSALYAKAKYKKYGKENEILKQTKNTQENKTIYTSINNKIESNKLKQKAEILSGAVKTVTNNVPVVNQATKVVDYSVRGFCFASRKISSYLSKRSTTNEISKAKSSVFNIKRSTIYGEKNFKKYRNEIKNFKKSTDKLIKNNINIIEKEKKIFNYLVFQDQNYLTERTNKFHRDFLEDQYKKNNRPNPFNVEKKVPIQRKL